MSKKRVHEIAKEQGLSSKELLEKLKAAGIDAKAAASSVEEARGAEGARPWCAARVRELQRRLRRSVVRRFRATAKRRGCGHGRPDSARALIAGCGGARLVSARSRTRASDGGCARASRRRNQRAGRAGAGRIRSRWLGRCGRRRARASHARLAHRRAHAGRRRAGRTPARGDRLSGLSSPAGRPVQPASAPPTPRTPPARHLRRDDRSDRHSRDGGHRPDSRELWLDRQGRRRVPRRGGARGDQEADVAGRDGDAHADALRRRDPGARRRVRQADRDRPRGRRRRGRAGVRGRRGGPDRTPARGHDHGPRRPRQDLAARRDPRDRGRRRRGRRHHPAHRRLPGAPRRQRDHLPRHARPRGVHRDARARRAASPTWR